MFNEYIISILIFNIEDKRNFLSSSFDIFH